MSRSHEEGTKALRHIGTKGEEARRQSEDANPHCGAIPYPPCLRASVPPCLPRRSSPRRPSPRNGFTLIEILVVIGVILILLSMSLVGYNVVERAAAANQTKTTLANLNAMLSDLDAAAGSNALPAYGFTSTSQVWVLAPRPAHFATITTTTGTLVIGAGITDSSGQSWTIGDVSSHGADRYGWVVQQTAKIAMAKLLHVANNSKAVAQLPSTKLLRNSDGTPYANGTVLLDGWDNPIIYVPPGGIVVNVTTGNGVPQLVTIQSRDGRPFFASAGPDGDFGAVTSPAPPQGTTTAGDDNGYSREQ